MHAMYLTRSCFDMFFPLSLDSGLNQLIPRGRGCRCTNPSLVGARGWLQKDLYEEVNSFGVTVTT